MAKLNKFSLGTNRSRSKTSSIAKMISWLLILILSTGPFQSSIAMHFDLNAQDQANQVLVVPSQEIVSTSDGQSCIVNYCQVLSACAAHLNCNPSTSSSSPQLSAQAQFFYHLTIGKASVSTRFPDLLKRPPDHSPLTTCLQRLPQFR
jgi:hypothetical protein